MPSYVTPKKATEFVYPLKLPSVSGGWQASPTLAAGDIKVEKDGGAAANIDDVPTVVGSTVWLVLSETEMDADNIIVTFSDVADDEWMDASVSIQTTDRQIDDLATQAKQDISDTKIDELHKLEGLDSSNPVTTTPTSRDAGSISQVISGDGITTSTVTRP